MTNTTDTATLRAENAWLRAVLATIAQAVDDQRADGMDRLGWIRDTAASAALGGDKPTLGGDDVVLAFRNGRERRMTRAEWEQLVAGKFISGVVTYQPQEGQQ